jgi:hypothetical protein
MAPPSAMDKLRDSRQERELVDMASSALTPGDGTTVANRASVRISQAHIGLANDLRPLTPATPVRSTTPIRSPSPVSPLLPGSLTQSPVQSRSPSPSPSPLPQPQNYRSSIAKGPPVGLGLDMDLGDEENSSSDIPFNPNASRFNRSDSSASSHSSGGSPYRSRISQISFSYPRRSPSAASNVLRPAHPYGLYQQTTFEEPEDPIDDTESSSSVGLGRPANFSRRRGPDGEELDVIGPDGHAEQLPPYTRYPDVGPSSDKRSQSDPNAATLPLLDTAIAGPSSSSNPVLSSSPISDTIAESAPLLGAVTTPLATHPDPFLAMGHSQPQSSPITQSPTMSTLPPGDGNESRGVPSSASSLLEKKNREAWRKKSHKKVLCGTIPLWSVLLFAILCIFLAVIAGGVIGGMVSQQKSRNNHNRGDTVTVTDVKSMIDASPIPSPTGIPAASLPTGTFFFPLGAPSEQERRCIEPSRDSTAWSCGVTNQLLLIDFGRLGNYPTAKIYPAPLPKAMEGTTQFGAQPPRGNPVQKMQWVTDLRDTGRGPALWFQTVYNKIVVIEGEKFPSADLHLRSTPEELSKRAFDDKKDYKGPAPSMSVDPNVSTRYANKPGEEPWYCYFNGTTIEAFIYPQQQISGANTQQFTASQITTDMYSPTAISNSVAPLTGTTTEPTATPTSPQVSARAVLLPRTPGSKPTTTSDVTTPPPRFPYIIKIDERRFPNLAFRPFCQKMTVNSDGSIAPKIDSTTGNKTIEFIKEPVWDKKSSSQKKYWKPVSENVRSSGQQGQMFKRALGEWDMSAEGEIVKKDTMPTNGCHCQWVSPFG